MLVLGLGPTTKRLGELMATDKKYTTVIDLSATTEGHDAESPRVDVDVQAIPTRVEVEEVIATFLGEILQTPPIFSAVKVNGRRAYAIARKGDEVSIPPRSVHVHAIEVTKYAWPFVRIDIECAKGFYVRSLARDVGIRLGVGGYCTEIRRTAVGPFTLEMASTLEDLPEVISQKDLIHPQEIDRLLAK